MQYKPKNERVAMMNARDISIPTPLSRVEDPQIRRTRETLMVILGVCHALTMATWILVIAGSNTQINYVENSKGLIIGQAVVEFLFCGFGILVAYRYSQIGLRIFAWLTIIDLVGMSILLVFLLVIAIANMHYDPYKNVMIGAVVVLFVSIGVCTVYYVLSVIIVILAFKLAQLIDANKRFPIQQI